MRATVEAAALPRPRDVTGEFGIYVHVPFCAHRCFYCDFNAYAGLDHLAEGYMQALARDAREAWSAPDGLVGRPPVTSIFIGGGTPSLVDPTLIVDVLDAIRQGWQLNGACEVTIECNPESTTPEKLEAYLAGGINRVSFGVQSLDALQLTTLGRLHDAATALEAIRSARDVGFDRVNADLIFGVPGEEDDGWRRSIEGVLDAGATHLSCYGLTYEEGTPLHAWRRLGRIVPVAEDDAARRWEIACELLAEAGFERYEIANWARPGQASRHNRLYWAFGEYLGVGAGAHSHLADEGGSTRSWTVKGPQRYARAVAAGDRPVSGSEPITTDARCAEVMFLGLRRSEGVSTDEFRRLTGAELGVVYAEELRGARDAGLLCWDGERARLTERGTLLANDVLTLFLP